MGGGSRMLRKQKTKMGRLKWLSDKSGGHYTPHIRKSAYLFMRHIHSPSDQVRAEARSIDGGEMTSKVAKSELG